MAQLSIDAIKVEVQVAAALAGPDEGPSVLEETQIVVEVDPGRAAFPEQIGLLERCDIDPPEIEPLLVAALQLVAQMLVAVQPVDAGEIDVGVGTEIDPACFAALGRDQAERDRDVSAACRRIALLDHLGAVGKDLAALDDGNLRFVVAFKRNH